MQALAAVCLESARKLARVRREATTPKDLGNGVIQVVGPATETLVEYMEENDGRALDRLYGVAEDGVSGWWRQKPRDVLGPWKWLAPLAIPKLLDKPELLEPFGTVVDLESLNERGQMFVQRRLCRALEDVLRAVGAKGEADAELPAPKNRGGRTAIPMEDKVAMFRRFKLAGVTQKEFAWDEGISEGKVSSWLSDARKFIKGSGMVGK